MARFGRSGPIKPIIITKGLSGGQPISINLAGSSASSALGALVTDIDILFLGLSSTVGTSPLVTDISFVCSGVAPIASVGLFDIGASFGLASITSNGVVGDFISTVNIAIDGLASAGQIGIFDIVSGSLINLVSVAATPQFNTLSFQVDANLNLIGVSAPTAQGIFTVNIPAEILLVAVYSIMRNNPVPASGEMSNDVVACQGALWTER